MTEAQELADLVGKMSEDEVRVFLLLARRVDRARAAYGALDLRLDTRDMGAELLAEIVDGLFYGCAAIMRSKR